MEEHTDESLEDDDLEDADDTDAEEGDAPAAAPAAAAGGEEVESSLEELLAKREERRPTEEEEEDDSLLNVERDERLEPLAVKVVPPTDKEFVCSNCHLVKHRAQLSDKARMLCRDCA